MNAIGFRNLRSLRETPELEIKPITIFVGANSSGKSTFLRALPLLRQSVEARKASPILWYGRFVDFGSFREAVFRNDNKLPIEFRFTFEYQQSDEDDEYWDPDVDRPIKPAPDPYKINIAVNVSGTDTEFRGYTSQINLTVGADRIAIHIGDNGTVREIKVNDSNLTAKFSPLKVLSRGNIVPRLGMIVPRQVERPDKTTETVNAFVTNGFSGEQMVSLLSPFFSGSAKKSTIEQFTQRLDYGTIEQIIAQTEKEAVRYRILQKRIKALTGNRDLLEQLRLCIIMENLPGWLTAAESELRGFAGSVSYIAPVRASTERYYRAQDLAVDEVDPHGDNIPMFLQSLTFSERESLSAWLTEHFNFSVVAEYSSGHVSLRFKEPEQENYYNLADMGFGFSQILPILVQIWVQGNHRLRRPMRAQQQARLFAIEQPELHLHPKLQAKFADLLASATKQSPGSRLKLRFVVETHSEAMINRFGALIRSGLLSATDINVVVFERDAQTQETAMRIAHFDDKGQLVNWPFGFFSADTV